MSVIVEDMVDVMISALQGAGKLDGVTGADLAALKADMIIAEGARWSYLASNIEVKGVDVGTSTLLSSPTPLVPVPTDGGLAVSTQMVSNADGTTLSQNNSGTVE